MKQNPNREELKADGFFDGRYKQKVIPDKKKEERKRRGRKKPGAEE